MCFVFMLDRQYHSHMTVHNEIHFLNIIDRIIEKKQVTYMIRN